MQGMRQDRLPACQILQFPTFDGPPSASLQRTDVILCYRNGYKDLISRLRRVIRSFVLMTSFDSAGRRPRELVHESCITSTSLSEIFPRGAAFLS